MGKLKTQSLQKRHSDLANTNKQLEILSGGILPMENFLHLRVKSLKPVNFH